MSCQNNSSRNNSSRSEIRRGLGLGETSIGLGETLILRSGRNAINFSPGVRHSQILSRPGVGWALAYPRATRGHLTRVFERWMSLLGRGLCQS